MGKSFTFGAALACGPMTTSEAPAPESLLPVLLVHGGGHGAWCWELLEPLLDGPHHAVDLPPTSVRRASSRAESPPDLFTLTAADFATAVLAETDALGWDRFLLVGHSLAGITIPEVARRAPERVAHLVFVSASIPPEGGAVIDTLPTEIQDLARGATERGLQSATTTNALPVDLMTHMFCNDMDEAQTAFVLDHVGNEVVGVILEPITRAGIDPAIESTYVRLTQDQSVSPDMQTVMIENLAASPGNPVHEVELDSAHDVMISNPALLAPVINNLARTHR